MRSTFYGHIKEIPGYKLVLQTILKSLIQQMVEQLAEYGEEETVVLTTSVANYCFSPLGSKSGLAFLEQRADIKSDFMQFCLKHTSQLEERNPKLNSWNNIRSGPQSDDTITVDEDNTTIAHADDALQTLTEPLVEVLYAGNHGSEGEGKGRVFINRHKKKVHPLVKSCLKEKILRFPYTDTGEDTGGISRQETTRVTETTQTVSKEKYRVRLTEYDTGGKPADQVMQNKAADKTTDQVTNHGTVGEVTPVELKDTDSKVTPASSSDVEVACQTAKTLSSEGVEFAKTPRVLVHKIQIPRSQQHATFVVGPDSHINTDGQISPNQRIPGRPNQRASQSSLVQTPQSALVQSEREGKSVSTQIESTQTESFCVTKRKYPSKSKFPKTVYPSSQAQVSFSACRPQPEISYSSGRPHQIYSSNQHERRSGNSITHPQPKIMYSGSLHQSKISNSTSHPNYANNSSSNQPPLKLSYYFSQSETEINKSVSQPEPNFRSDQSPIVAHSMRLPYNIGGPGLDTDYEPVKIEVADDNEFTDNTSEQFKWNKDYNYSVFNVESKQIEDWKPPAEECNLIESSKHPATNEIQLKEEPVDVITSVNSSSDASVVSLSQKVVGETLLCSLSSSDNSSTHTSFVPVSDMHPVETEPSLDLSVETTSSGYSNLTFPVIKRLSSSLVFKKRLSKLKRLLGYKSQPTNVNSAKKQQVLAYLSRNRKSPDPDSDLSEYLTGGI